MLKSLRDCRYPLSAAACAGCLALLPLTAVAEPPRLILQITVDALRGDLPQRHLPDMGKGGFRYLFEKGVNYTAANYQHGNTETIVGHTSLATGTTPALHGMVVAATHGSPWNYDTFVPVFFAGQGINNATVNRPVTPYDIAPTLSARIGITAPSGSVGQPLGEVLD